MPSPTVDPFPPDALEINRSGSLTDAQRERLKKFALAGRPGRVLTGLFFAFVGVVLMRTTGRGPNGWMLPWVGLAIIAGGVGAALHALGFGDRLLADLREGRVENVEGAIAKVTFRGAGAGSRTLAHYLRVEGRRFRIGPAAFAAAPDAGIVRVYYLPKSTRVVNLERLPDRPLPPGLMDSPIEALRTLGQALRSRGTTRSAEASATLAALKSAIAGPDRPPPAAERESRPLAEAIIGRWRVGPLALEFARGGFVTMRSPTGEERTGRWWVDAEGRLHSDAQGEEQSGEAWVAGDALTLSIGGNRITLHRA